jgi:hypothetical protein
MAAPDTPSGEADEPQLPLGRSERDAKADGRGTARDEGA